MIKIAVAIGEFPPDERQRRIEAAQSFTTTEIIVGALPVMTRPFDHDLSPLAVTLAAPAYIDAFRQAEIDGYHAVVPFGVWDIGVEGGKSAVDIPVVGACEAMLHTAAMLGTRFGIVLYHSGQIPMVRDLIRRYGMEQWVAGIRVTGLTLGEITGEQDAVASRFLKAGRALVAEDGAEVILAMGITQCPLAISATAASAEIGVPVLEGIGTPIRFAAHLAALGLRQSRVRWPLPPSRR